MTTIKTSRTKSGKTVPVAYITASDMTEATAEGRAAEATKLAVAAGCGDRHWRIVDASGAVIQAPSLSTAQAAGRSGPSGERHDW